MGMDMFVYTESPVEDSSVLVHLREWTETGGTWVCKSKNWQVVVNGSQTLEAADAGPERDEVLRIRPRVRFQTEINIEGRLSTEAMTVATCSAQKVAFRLHGLIFDPQLEALIVPLSEGPFARIPAPAAA